MGTYTDIFIHSFLQCIRTIKSCCCFSFFFSAPADPLAEDESTHTAGNGVVTEVGGVQACVLFCLFVSFCCHVLIEIFPPCVFRQQGMLQGRMVTVTATVMMTMMTSALRLET